MNKTLTPSMARQLEIVRAAGQVRDTMNGRDVKGLTSPVLRKLCRLGLVTIAMEIETYTWRRGRQVETSHAVVWVPV